MGEQGIVPFLTVQGFNKACQQLATAYRRYSPLPLHIDLRTEVQRDYVFLTGPLLLSSQQDGRDYLKMTRTVMTDRVSDCYEESLDDLGEDDIGINVETDEAAVQSVEKLSIIVEYDIILSPTYRVPVLYFKPYQVSPSRALGLDFVYQHLVSDSSIAQLQETSVMGGITIANHPITDIPCFFVHPCNTPDAMCEIIDTRMVSELEYLQIWIGLIGSSVGLYLPKELAIKDIKDD